MAMVLILESLKVMNGTEVLGHKKVLLLAENRFLIVLGQVFQ